MKSLFAMAALAAILPGCMFLGGFGAPKTPLPPAEVATLTTCKTGDLVAIKKNLVLNGYSLRIASDDTLETSYKQTEGGYGAKLSERISVVKIDPSTAKFHVRIRQEGMQKVETGRARAGAYEATQHELVKTDDETDREDTVEDKAFAEKTRVAVCGQ